MGDDTALAILERVEGRLARTERSFHEFLTRLGAEKREAFGDVVVYARSVTHVMQTARNVLPAFEPWYAQHVAAMSADEGFRRLVTIRNDLLKTGKLANDVYSQIVSRNRWMPTAPDNATSFVAYDDLTGKWGWAVRAENGTEQCTLFDFPEGVEPHQFFAFLPPLPDHTPARVEETVSKYLSYLRRMVAEFRALVLSSG